MNAIIIMLVVLFDIERGNVQYSNLDFYGFNYIIAAAPSLPTISTTSKPITSLSFDYFMELWYGKIEKIERKNNGKYRQTLCKRKISRKLHFTDFQMSNRRDIVLLISSTHSYLIHVNGWMVGVVKCLDVRSPSHLFHSCACRVSFVVILPELKFYFTFLYWANQSGCGTVLSIFYFSCSQRNQWKNNELKWNAAERDQKHWMCKIGIWRTDFDSEYFVVCVRASHHLKIRTDNK